MPKSLEGENDAALNAVLDAGSLFNVRGKVALVTGGGSGIGAMVAAGLAGNGGTVYIVSRKDTSAFSQSLSSKPEVRAAGGSAHSLQGDLAVNADVVRVIGEIKRREGKLNILINNAGTNYSAPLGKGQPDMFDKVMQVNVRAVFQATQEALPLLRASGTVADPSRVVNVSSIQGLRAPATDTFAYSAAKSAVVMLSEHIAGKVAGKHITVNTICPGPFQSRMMRGTISMMGGEDAIAKTTALGKMGSPEDAAGCILYLCGRAGAFVTGAVIAVDGGALVKTRL